MYIDTHAERPDRHVSLGMSAGQTLSKDLAAQLLAEAEADLVGSGGT